MKALNMIWEIQPDVNNFRRLSLENVDQDWKLVTYSLNGERLSDEWKPLPVRFEENQDKRGQQLQSGDFPGLLGLQLIAGIRALSILRPLIANHVEALALNCDNCDSEKFYIINIVTVLDCLDKAHSEVERFADGRVLRVSKFVFKTDCIGDVPIFKIPEHRLNKIFVGSNFKTLVEQSGLKGLIFTQLT